MIIFNIVWKPANSCLLWGFIICSLNFIQMTHIKSFSFLYVGLIWISLELEHKLIGNELVLT